MSLEAIQAQAGHRSIESTRIYLHLANDWLADEYLRALGRDRRRRFADDFIGRRGGGVMTPCRRSKPQHCQRRRLGTHRRSRPAAGCNDARYLAQQPVTLARDASTAVDRTPADPVRALDHRPRPDRRSRPPTSTAATSKRSSSSWHHRRPTTHRRAVGDNTIRPATVACCKVFFDRIIEWDYHDAPTPQPDHPRRRPTTTDEPLPKFLDDDQMPPSSCTSRRSEPDPLRTTLRR